MENLALSTTLGFILSRNSATSRQGLCIVVAVATNGAPSPARCPNTTQAGLARPILEVRRWPGVTAHPRSTSQTRQQRRHHPPPNPAKPCQANKTSRARDLVHLGELSAARQALLSGLLAPGTDATLAELRDPHRRAPTKPSTTSNRTNQPNCHRHSWSPTSSGLARVQPHKKISVINDFPTTTMRLNRTKPNENNIGLAA